MTRSVFCKRGIGLDVGIIQQQLDNFGVKFRVHPIRETFCFVSFDDEEVMVVFLCTRLLEQWFSEVRAWKELELADGSIRWVCMKGVPIPL